MKPGARNLRKGTVADVRADSVAAQVQVDIGGGNIVTPTITADPARTLASKTAGRSPLP